MKWIKIKDTEEKISYYKKNKYRTYTLNLSYNPLYLNWLVEFYVWDSLFQSGIESTIFHKREFYEKKENALKKLNEFKQLKI